MYSDLLYGKVVENKNSGYIVKSGDTIWGIARKYTGNGEDYVELKETNPFIKDITKLVIGELLIIPTHWVRLQTLKIVKDRKQFGYDMTAQLFIKWAEFYRLNSLQGIQYHTQHKRLMTMDETLTYIEQHDRYVASIAIAWVLLKRFEGIFSIDFYMSQHGLILAIGDRCYPSITPEGYLPLETVLTYPDIEKMRFADVVNHITDEDARLTVAFHQPFNIPLNSTLTEMIRF